MIVFNEGLPRSGKSYDAVETHILPALKAGRKVYARLNGLDHAGIAKYLELDEADVRARLIAVGKDEVHDLYQSVEPNSLVVIDECHDYYVASRNPLPHRQEEFFAMHGHKGLDIVLMSQFYKRLHSAVRGRVERKNLFRKMTAVGMKGRYTVSFYAAVAPDRYEKTGSEIRKYREEIWSLYQSVEPGAQRVFNYDQGGKKVWEGKLGYLTVIMIVGAIAGTWALFGFFDSDNADEVFGVSKIERPTAATKTGALAVTSRTAPTPAVVQAVAPPAPKLKPETQYIVDLSAQGRARLGALLTREDGAVFAVVEWVDANGRVMERMTRDQLLDLGWTVDVKQYGLRLSREGETVIATAWPRDFEARYSDQDIAQIQSTVRPLPSASEPAGTRSGLELVAAREGRADRSSGGRISYRPIAPASEGVGTW